MSWSGLCIPTVHPAFALRGHEAWLAVIEKDLERAFRLAKTGWDYRPNVFIGMAGINGLGFGETLKAIDTFFRTFDLRAGAPPIACDTETDNKEQYKANLRCISFSQVDSERAISVPYNLGIWGTQALEWLRSWIAFILGAPVAKLFHNAPYDRPVLKRHGFPITTRVEDTLTQAHTVESDLPHDLGFVCQRWLDVDPWKRSFDEAQKKADPKKKAQARWQDADWKDLLYYNARDALEDARVYRVLEAELKTIPNGPSVYELQLWENDLSVRMAEVGVPFAEDERRKLSDQLHAKRDGAVERIKQVQAWPDFNPRKKADRVDLLYRRCGLPIRKYTLKTQQPSTSFHAIIEHADRPEIRALIDYDEAASMLSNLVDKYAMPDMGRLHVIWNIHGVDGSRMSSSPNWQNHQKNPFNLRTMTKAPPGRIFVGSDYSALELRILAVFAGAQNLLQLFRNDADAHSWMAAQVFGRAFTEADPKTRKALRDLTKRVVYGMQYGAGAPKVYSVITEDKRTDAATRSLISTRLVQKIMNTFMEINPEVPIWRDATLDFVNTYGYITIPPFGRTRRFLTTPVDGPKAWNWPIQTCGHDHLERAMYLFDMHRRPTTYILIDGHDSIVAECDERDAEYTRDLMDWAMNTTLTGPGGTLALTAKADIGPTWAAVS